MVKVIYIFMLIMPALVLSCASSTMLTRDWKNYESSAKLFKKASNAYQSQNYVEAKVLFGELAKSDTGLWYYQSYAFLADSYVKIDQIDSGKSAYENGINRAYMKNKEIYRELKQWSEVFPNFPEALLEQSGFLIYDEPPTPLGGIRQVLKSLSYPDDAAREGVEGVVIVQLLINKFGRVNDARVVKSIHPQLDAAAVGALTVAPFNPAKKNGNPINARILVPVGFESTMNR